MASLAWLTMARWLKYFFYLFFFIYCCVHLLYFNILSLLYVAFIVESLNFTPLWWELQCNADWILVTFYLFYFLDYIFLPSVTKVSDISPRPSHNPVEKAFWKGFLRFCLDSKAMENTGKQGWNFKPLFQLHVNALWSWDLEVFPMIYSTRSCDKPCQPCP